MRDWEKFDDNSRVWIYQASKELSPKEVSEIESVGTDFTNQWAAHGKPLVAHLAVLENRFVVIFLDETRAGATGCSIDASVHFIQDLENRFKISLTNRTSVAYLNAANQIATAPMHDLSKQSGVDESTLVFNNLVQTKGELNSKWRVPAKDSWHAQLF